MTRGTWHRVAAAACIAGLAPACAPTDVTVAILPAEEEAGSEAGSEAASAFRCMSQSDCPAGSYCEKPTCDSNSGTCQLFPVESCNDEDPHCGCDGITYFNDCLRKASHVFASLPGTCPLAGAKRCAGPPNVSCPDGAVCGQLQGLGQSDCASNAEGSCWVLPAQCPPPGESEWNSCLPGGPRCLDTCTALQSGGPYSLASICH